VAVRLAGRKNDESRTFGYKRAEVLAALFNTALILGASVFMVKEAVGRLLHPVRINGWLVVVVALAGLLGNVGSILLLRRDARDSLNIRSSYLHLVSDAFSSVAVLVGGILVVLFKWDRADAFLTFVILGAVMWQGFRLLKETAGVLMESVPDHIRVEEIQTEVDRLPEVRNIHHLHVWQITDNDIHMEGHVNLREDLTVRLCQ
jgi:cobalt-zinc-cadmium efflux system protein